MKYFCCSLMILLAGVNAALLWGIYRKIKTAPEDRVVADLMPYLKPRLTAFAVNTAVIAVLFALYQIMTMLGRI